MPDGALRDLIVYGLDSSFTRVIRCVEDLTDAEAAARPHGLTPVIWQLGHLVVSDAGYLRHAGGEVELPAEFPDLFGMGTGGAAAFPPLGAVRPRFEEIQRRLLEAARRVDLDRPAEGRSYRTAGQVLIFVGYHRGYHIGKMTTLRALLRKPRLFG